jgi:multidrug resistance efflux pump
MLFIIFITTGYLLFCWLVFFRFKWLKLSPTWGVVSVFFLLHVVLGFIVGLRFVTPQSTDATVVQYTIQLIPRLTEPTVVTAVLAKQNVPLKKGTPLFQFDRRPYEYQIQNLEGQLASASAKAESARSVIPGQQAQIAAAKQNVNVLAADLSAAKQRVLKGQSDLRYANYEELLAQRLAKTGAGPAEDVQSWAAQVGSDQAAIAEARAGVARAQSNLDSTIGGVNTTVASAQSELEQGHANVIAANANMAAIKGQLALARYYLENTTMLAPADGRLVNVQVRPGMVAGIVRAGAIASFVVDADRYVLGSFNQEVLKFVKVGQPIELALNLYPGQIFRARVASIWYANGQGQYLPSDVIPNFAAPAVSVPQDRFAVQMTFDQPEKDNPAPAGFPIGTQGFAAVYTQAGGPWTALRKIALRAHSWLNWLYPLPF